MVNLKYEITTKCDSYYFNMSNFPSMTLVASLFGFKYGPYVDSNEK